MKTILTVLLIMELYGLSSGFIKQHYFVKQKMTWFSASMHCKTHFYDLSTFTNEKEEQQFLEDAARQPADAWVGLYNHSGVWKWSGGGNATRISWDTTNKQPEDDNCAFLHKTYKKLHDIDCNFQYSFFCMNISEFVLVRQNETWEGALQYCREHYNDMASLSSVNMMDSGLEKSTQAETEYVWTGLRYLAGDWFWVNGDDLDYKDWYQNEQPQCPAKNFHCGALDIKTMDWIHRGCEEKHNFLCSAQAVPLPVPHMVPQTTARGTPPVRPTSQP